MLLLARNCVAWLFLNFESPMTANARVKGLRLKRKACASVPQPGYLTAEVGVKNQMLSEPARRVSFGSVNEANCQIGEGHSTQKLFWFLFQL